MADRPFSPWRPVSDDSPPPPQLTLEKDIYGRLQLTGVLAQCQALYRELIKAQISPYEADKLELWQIAALMDDGSGDSEDSVRSQNEYFIEERQRAAKEGRELDAEEIVIGIADNDMDAFLRGAINSDS